MRYTDAIGACERGVLLTELDTAMANLANACRALNKGGSMTLTLELAPQNDDVFAVTGTFTVKEPKPKRKATMFYVDEEGQLHRRDPRQHELLRDTDDDETARRTG